MRACSASGWAVLFPEPPRRVWHARLFNVSFRTVHLAAFGLVLGGHAWGVGADRLLPALWVTIASGAALMALESLASARWLVEGRGLMVLLKLGLLLLVPFVWEHRLPILLAVVAIASVSSHMPARLRHAALPSIWLTAKEEVGLVSADVAAPLSSTGLLGKGEGI